MADWQIIDDNGVIHAGTESEMQIAFEHMINNLQELEQLYPDYNIGIIESTIEQWSFDWEGDLKLVQIHQIHR